ncbi:hypothetical protein GR11A_00160 [Vibrio phage vB_VcorM_GR11A]|nr:hypothetical protein GR11A_00160 [Vibrio phage vB_VcorM_GR11A]
MFKATKLVLDVTDWAWWKKYWKGTYATRKRFVQVELPRICEKFGCDTVAYDTNTLAVKGLVYVKRKQKPDNNFKRVTCNMILRDARYNIEDDDVVRNQNYVVVMPSAATRQGRQMQEWLDAYTINPCRDVWTALKMPKTFLKKEPVPNVFAEDLDDDLPFVEVEVDHDHSTYGVTSRTSHYGFSQQEKAGRTLLTVHGYVEGIDLEEYHNRYDHFPTHVKIVNDAEDKRLEQLNAEQRSANILELKLRKEF